MSVGRWAVTSLLLCFGSQVAETKKKASSKASSKRFQMLDPVRVGHTRSVLLPDGPDGRKVEMETLALDPPIFLVKGLLHDQEADDTVEASNSKNFKWKDSQEGFEDNRVVRYKGFLQDEESWEEVFGYFDKDEDLTWDEEEVRAVARQVFGVGRHNHTEFLRHHKLTVKSKKPPKIPRAVAFKRGGFVKYFMNIKKKNPEKTMRYGSHLWIRYKEHQTARRLKNYTRTVSNWSTDLFTTSIEKLQIAHYPVGGHFSCHLDATNTATRMATMIFFLNNPKEGGELVFPGADMPNFETISEGDEFRSNCSDHGGCLRLGRANGVVVKPAKGDAVFWYNMRSEMLKKPGAYNRHDLVFERSVHCGADVSAGEKYIATVWINMPPEYTYEDGTRYREEL